MPDERLYLLLVVYVPDPDDPVFAAADQVLPVGREAQRLVEVALDRSVVLLALEQYLLLRFQVPLKQAAIL